MKQAALIIGASSGLGRSVAEQLAKAGHDVIISSRSEEDLKALSAHLQVRYQINAAVKMLDLAALDADSAAIFVQHCFDLMPNCTQVYITAGIIDDRDKGSDSVDYLPKLMQVNCLGISYIMRACCMHLQNKASNITVISSIAAIRPRGANIAYSASKIALEYMALGLRHHFAAGPMRIQVYRAGYMETALSRGKKLLFPVAKPERVAQVLIKNRNKDTGLAYVPVFWLPLSWVLQYLPWFIFKKLKF